MLVLVLLPSMLVPVALPIPPRCAQIFWHTTHAHPRQTHPSPPVDAQLRPGILYSTDYVYAVAVRKPLLKTRLGEFFFLCFSPGSAVPAVLPPSPPTSRFGPRNTLKRSSGPFAFVLGPLLGPYFVCLFVSFLSKLDCSHRRSLGFFLFAPHFRPGAGLPCTTKSKAFLL
jgi:hypothetical protein